MRITTIITDIVQIINRSHSDLQNLTADDHTHYLLVDGSRALTGDLNLGGYNIKSTNSLLKFDTELTCRNAADTDYISITAKSFRTHASVYFAASGASIYGYASAIADNKFIVYAGGAWKEVGTLKGATLTEDGRFYIKAGTITGDLRDGNHTEGAVGQVLTSQGAGTAPLWTAPPKLEYVEIAPISKQQATAGVWEDWNISATIPAAALYVQVNATVWTGASVGVREDGSTIARTITTPTGYNIFVFTFTTSVKTTKIIETFNSYADSSARFYVVGYWK